ncbi:MAG: hypothetical protein ACRYFK_08405 [Janthinobacterium lividum]
MPLASAFQQALGPRRWPWLVGGALTLGLLPWVALAWFNQPFWDDFGHAAQARHYGVWGAQRYLYAHWTGRYFSSLLLTAANPLTYGWPAGLRLVPLGALGGLGLVLAASLRVLGGRALGGRRALAGGAALLLALLYTLPSPYSAIYWFASVAIYQVGTALLVVLPLAGWRAQRASRPGARAGWYGLAVLAAAALAGTNELTLVLAGWLLACWAGLAYRRTGGAGARPWLGLLAVAAAGGGVLLAAPGNAVRLAQDAPAVPPALWQVAARASAQTVLFLTEPRQLTALLVLPVLLAPLAYRARRHPAAPRLPLGLGLAVVGGGLGLSMLVLSRVAWGYPATRILNLLWAWTLLGSLLAAWLALPTGPAVRPPRRLLALRPLLLGYAALLLLGGPSRAAGRELLENAPAWRRQQLARQAALGAAARAGQRQVRLAPVRGIRPQGILILGETLDSAARGRPNQAAAAYYDLDSVRLSPPGLAVGDVQGR